MKTIVRRAGAVSSSAERLILCAATALAMAAAGFAHASTVVPGATYNNIVSATPGGYPRFQGDSPFAEQYTQQPTGGLAISGNPSYPSQTTFFAAATDNRYTIPSLYASVRATGNVMAGAASSLIYYFEFGGAAGTTVTRDVKAYGSATSSADDGAEGPGDPTYDNASAYFYITDQKGNGDLVQDAANSYNNDGTKTFSFDKMVTFDVNTVYMAFMAADAGGAYDHSAEASIDPYIDLSNLPDGVTFSISNGIGDLLPTAGATPIPATLPLFASGLSWLGLLGWRRRRKAAMAA